MTQANINLKVGANLKKYIKESKFKTQERFALEGVGYDPTTVRRWIHNGIDSLTTIEYVANVLGINFLELFK